MDSLKEHPGKCTPHLLPRDWGKQVPPTKERLRESGFGVSQRRVFLHLFGIGDGGAFGKPDAARLE